MTSKYRKCNDDFYDECDERGGETKEQECDCSRKTSIEKNLTKGFDCVRKKMVAFNNIFSQPKKKKKKKKKNHILTRRIEKKPRRIRKPGEKNYIERIARGYNFSCISI